MATNNQRPASNNQFKRILRKAIEAMVREGYKSLAQIHLWIIKLKDAFMNDLGRFSRYAAHVRSRFVQKARKVGKSLEMERRIAATIQIIQDSIVSNLDDMIRRFTGWATSVPAGGTKLAEMLRIRNFISKPYAKAKNHERTIIKDQMHKMVCNTRHENAVKNGAIGAIWHSNWRKEGYDYRECHKERDGTKYGLRGSGHKFSGYTDQIEMVGELPNCKCWYEYIYN